MPDKKSHPESKDYVGFAIAIGAGLGIIFGELIFDDIGVGVSVGTGLGIALSSLLKTKH